MRLPRANAGSSSAAAAVAVALAMATAAQANLMHPSAGLSAGNRYFDSMGVDRSGSRLGSKTTTSRMEERLRSASRTEGYSSTYCNRIRRGPSASANTTDPSSSFGSPMYHHGPETSMPHAYNPCIVRRSLQSRSSYPSSLRKQFLASGSSASPSPVCSSPITTALPVFTSPLSVSTQMSIGNHLLGSNDTHNVIPNHENAQVPGDNTLIASKNLGNPCGVGFYHPSFSPPPAPPPPPLPQPPSTTTTFQTTISVPLSMSMPSFPNSFSSSIWSSHAAGTTHDPLLCNVLDDSSGTHERQSTNLQRIRNTSTDMLLPTTLLGPHVPAHSIENLVPDSLMQQSPAENHVYSSLTVEHPKEQGAMAVQFIPRRIASHPLLGTFQQQQQQQYPTTSTHPNTKIIDMSYSTLEHPQWSRSRQSLDRGSTPEANEARRDVVSFDLQQGGRLYPPSHSLFHVSPPPPPSYHHHHYGSPLTTSSNTQHPAVLVRSNSTPAIFSTLHHSGCIPMSIDSSGGHISGDSNSSGSKSIGGDNDYSGDNSIYNIPTMDNGPAGCQSNRFNLSTPPIFLPHHELLNNNTRPPTFLSSTIHTSGSQDDQYENHSSHQPVQQCHREDLQHDWLTRDLVGLQGLHSRERYEVDATTMTTTVQPPSSSFVRVGGGQGEECSNSSSSSSMVASPLPLTGVFDTSLTMALDNQLHLIEQIRTTPEPPEEVSPLWSGATVAFDNDSNTR
ncbi:hypothetical protein BGZ94_004627 [Podila epigama]|nr:hypothetical protein BGZ94_004627 [Podila epigama]